MYSQSRWQVFQQWNILYIGDEMAFKYVSAWFQPFEVFEVTLNHQLIGKTPIASAREFTVLRSKNAK